MENNINYNNKEEKSHLNSNFKESLEKNNSLNESEKTEDKIVSKIKNNIEEINSESSSKEDCMRNQEIKQTCNDNENNQSDYENSQNNVNKGMEIREIPRIIKREEENREGHQEENKEENQNIKIEENNKRYKFINIYSIFGIILLIIAIIIGFIFINSISKEQYIILDDEENETFEENSIGEDQNKKYKAIISIDFGSSYSGFAIVFEENTIESKLENIQPTTIVILKNSLQGYRYGDTAETFMNEPRSNDYIYFDRIKTKLDPKFKNDIQSKIYVESKSPMNYKINLRIIIKEYLRLFSDDALKYYNRKGNTEYSKDDIKWIVTVPAIWNEYGKQFKRNCAKKAGMNKVIIALEPEAASLTMFKDDNVDQKYKEKGKVFMLIDAGGYTLDITINEIVDQEGNLKQLSPPSGGAYGSMNINDDIIKLVEETFTKEKIYELRKYRYDLWKTTLDSIERKKKELRDDGSDSKQYKIDIKFENICELGTLSWILGKKTCSKKISYGNVEYDNQYLYINKDIMKKILLKNVDNIINHIKKLVKEFPKIDLFVLTGGFAKCVLLKQELKRFFNDTYKEKQIIYTYKELIDPEVSIMKGPALYGVKPSQIISRKSPYTIGTSVYSIRKEGTECRNMENYKCKYFDVFIRKGDDIKNNEEISHYGVPMYEFQDTVSFPLYFSKNRNQIYIDDNAFMVSNFSMPVTERNIPNDQRIYELLMEFGSCITVRGKNMVSGEKIQIFANYYNRDD